MKSTAFLAKFYLILFVKIIHGQQNGMVNNQNVGTQNILPHQQPTNAIVNTLQRLLNQNGNAGNLPNNFDHQVLIQTNKSPSFQNTINTAQKIQQPPDLAQEIVPLQQQLQQQHLQVPQSSQFLQPLSQQLIPTQHSAVQEQFQPKHIFQPQEPLQQIAQTVGFQDNSRIPVPGLQQNFDLPQVSVVQQNSYQPSSNLKLKVESPNPLTLHNNGLPLSAQFFNGQPPHSAVPPVEVLTNPQPTDFKTPDVSSVKYFISSQQAPSMTLNSVGSQNPTIAIIPSNNLGSTKQAYTPSYNYVNPCTEIHSTVVDRQKDINSVFTLPAVLTLPSQPVQNAQTYYYKPTAGSRQNVYISQNTQPLYSQQPKFQVTALPTQPASAVVPNQSSVLSPIPLTIMQPPSTIPQYGQYGISSSYPINSVVAPAYSTQKSKNLKSFLPLIFNLLKEKFACKSSCQSGCPCDCSKKGQNNELEVSSGYSNLKNYGALKEDALSVLGTVSGECDGIECLRQRKNLKTEKETPEVSDETQEDEDSDEEGDEDEEEE